MGDAAWCRLCLGREPPFSPVEGKWLDLITFTLGNLALSINPDLRLPSPLLCKVCEKSMVEFKKFKTMVQRNIQFIIDNKDAIQTHGLPFLQLNKEGETEARNAPTEPLEEVDELLEKPDCKELNKIFDKDCTPEVKEEDTFSEGEDYEDYYEEDEELETETKAKKRRRHKAYPGYCNACERQYADLNAHRAQIHQIKPALKCDFCDKVFLGQKLLRMHIKRHNQATIPCAKCGAQIKEAAMAKHLKYKHKEVADIKCTFLGCEKLFKQPQTLKNHIKAVHEKQRVLCINCGASVANIFLHRQKCLPDGKSAEKIECPLCFKSFYNKQQYEYHERAVHQTIVKPCSLCGKMVKDMDRHIQNMHNASPVKGNKCPEPGCGKEFKTRAELKNHNDAVHLQLREQCPQCDRWFTVTHLKTHIRKVHKADPKPSMMIT